MYGLINMVLKIEVSDENHNWPSSRNITGLKLLAIFDNTNKLACLNVVLRHIKNFQLLTTLAFFLTLNTCKGIKLGRHCHMAHTEWILRSETCSYYSSTCKVQTCQKFYRWNTHWFNAKITKLCRIGCSSGSFVSYISVRAIYF